MRQSAEYDRLLDVNRRSYALDALRGFAILTMILSGIIPFGVLPSWMYHAQVPPPSHVFNPNLPGITWVDLVFPFFLFAMGAAIPLALAKRIEQGAPYWKIVSQVLVRGLLLGGFAIYIEHVRPYTLNPEPNRETWLLSLLGFVLLFPIFMRLPNSWRPWIRLVVKVIGWGGAIAFMAMVRYPDGSRFSLDRSDIIIKVLANVAVFGSLIWLATQRNWLLRLGTIGVYLAILLSSSYAGWVQIIFNKSPIPWLFRMDYLRYLFIVIPGTIAGDMICTWMKSAKSEDAGKWPAWRFAFITVLMFGFVAVMLVGLKARLLIETTLVGSAMCLLAWWLVCRPRNETEKLIRDLVAWGIFWLVLGLAFEPYEGGIKKDHATMSYYFVTCGLAIFMLIAFTIIIDVFKKKRPLQLLIDNGQNPMIAYAGVSNFILPVLALTNLSLVLQRLTPTPWLGFLRGLFETILMALVVSFFTRRKVFWRT